MMVPTRSHGVSCRSRSVPMETLTPRLIANMMPRNTDRARSAAVSSAQ
jgi:hypothetical protein